MEGPIVSRGGVEMVDRCVVLSWDNARPVLLTPSCAVHITRGSCEIADSHSVAWALRFCNSSKFTGDGDAVGPRIKLGVDRGGGGGEGWAGVSVLSL